MGGVMMIGGAPVSDVSEIMAAAGVPETTMKSEVGENKVIILMDIV